MTLHLQKMLFPMLFCVLLGALHVTAQAGCGPPPRVNNGRPDSTNTFFPVNDMVRYQCNSGYAATKNSSLRLQCVANGTWGELNYWCERKTCSPKPIDQGSYTGGISFGDTITYTCDDGYALTGKTYQLTCMADGTWNPVDPPDCQPVSCPEIDLTEKLVFQLSLQYQYGSRVTYSCEAGFSLIGDSFRDCLESGKWSGSKPICKDVKCKTPQWDISHGQAMGERKEAYKYNDIVRYECSARYRAEPSEIHCTESNEWSATVNCVLRTTSLPRTEDPLQCSCDKPPAIEHGEGNDKYKSVYACGYTLSYKCKTCYFPVHSEITCQQNGQWSHSPGCVFNATCVIVPVVIIVALIGAMLAFAFFKKIACFAPSGSKTINDPRKNENEIPLNDTMSLKPNDA
uniref:Sushi, von Willebrand factor type A, EGF and pentraxin domain-containing protein 1-like isoform X6 n=1 Tax=Petromyzon marinus TaxID=7757 RepID=A0AAJ7WTW9_PETMA|nr:sushi, von Willebrand factor type A, EGF and pentraxin domain-containing protein 1-like isoform X6 [Petromyzon marinus]